jgi:hypothetical protein
MGSLGGPQGLIIIGPAGVGNLGWGPWAVRSAVLGCIANAYVAEHLARATGNPIQDAGR